MRRSSLFSCLLPEAATKRGVLLVVLAIRSQPPQCRILSSFSEPMSLDAFLFPWKLVPVAEHGSRLHAKASEPPPYFPAQLTEIGMAPIPPGIASLSADRP